MDSQNEMNRIMTEFQTLLSPEDIGELHHDMEMDLDDCEDADMFGVDDTECPQLAEQVFHLGLTQEEQNPRRKQEEKTFYYNVKKTDNPYIDIYTETQMENLSDNFKVSKEQVWNIGYCFHPLTLRGHHRNSGEQHVVVYETIREALKGYKEQLLLDKKKVIIDTHLITEEIGYVLTSLKHEIGLSINKEGRVILKRERKSTATSTTTPNITKGEICRNFKCALESYTEQKLGFHITVTVRVNALHKVLAAFKTLLPAVTYDQLCGEGDIPSYWYTKSQKAENMWNNPKLAKPKKKPTKKEKK